MKHKISTFLITLVALVFWQGVSAQTLFTIEGEEVSVKEFERVYTKNNINNQADYSEESLNEYLDLYIKFRLKVKEAMTLKMDTLLPLQSELSTYRKQLAKNYLSDKKVTDDLVLEAYERLQKELDVSHLLIAWPSENPTPADSINVFKEITSIKKKLSKSSFASLAKTYSDDPSAKDNEGRLGFITAFQTVYPFETAMYNTAIGEVSDPVATRFGYHLVYVHDARPARGKMTTAHILVKSKSSDDEDKKEAATEKVEKIHSQLTEGELKFDIAVKMHSEDKKTKFKNGMLPELSSAEMSDAYADAAFALKTNGEISQPVKTSLGWHIIKRVSVSEMGDFEMVKNDIQKRVERDTRSKVAEDVMLADTKEKFNFKLNESAKDEIISSLAASYNNNSSKLDEKESYAKVLFAIGTTSIKQQDFVDYVQKYFQRRSAKTELLKPVIAGYYDKFERQTLKQYREDNLEEINEDFKNLMQEYHDGILLFELTNNEVWNKAVEDKEGLEAFHAERSSDYMWGERISYTTYSTSDEKAAIKLKKFVTKGWGSDKILSKLNKKENLVQAYDYTFEKDASNLNRDLTWVKGFIAEGTGVNGEQLISIVNEVLEPQEKKLDETRGYVISDYQDYLEKNWISELQQKYKIVMNDAAFNALIKK